MRNYKHEISAYLDEVANREQDYLDSTIERIKHSKYVCLFGAGITSYTITSFLRQYTDIRIDFLCDNDPAKWGSVFHGDLVCISPAELEKYRDHVAVIIATQYYQDIFKQLREKGFQRIFLILAYRLLHSDYFKSRENIQSIQRNATELFNILEDEKSKQITFDLIRNWFDFDIAGAGYAGICSRDPYYPSEIIELTDHEAFVDAGAYDGDTLLEFIQKTHGNFDSIHAFELDTENFNELENTCNTLDPDLRARIRLHNLGLSDQEKLVFYETGSDKGQNSRISAGDGGDGLNTGKTARLSDILRDQKVTFVKMDIEGSELSALHGAEEMIKRQEPKLAVCVYHRPEHLWEIPIYLKATVSRYRIFIRHHSTLDYETVCYAVL